MLLIILNKLPLSTRIQCIEPLNKRFCDLTHSAELWHKMVLSTDPQWRNNVSTKLLAHLIDQSTSNRLDPDALQFRPCPVATLDLRGTTCCFDPDTISLILNHMPNLKELFAHRLPEEHMHSPSNCHLHVLAHAAVRMMSFF